MKHSQYWWLLVAIMIFSPILALAQPSYDLDIADNLGNLVGNTMSLSIAPGLSGTGQFWLVNPDRYNNVDPDPYGNQNLSNIYYTVSDLNHLTAYYWISQSDINVGLTPIPYSLNNGVGVFVDVTVNVPTDQYEGTYEGWIVVYDEVAEVSDSFKLKVMVGAQEDVDIVEENISGSTEAMNELRFINRFTVLNPTEDNNPDPDYFGNVDLYNLRFAAQNFVNIGDSSKYINSSHIFLAVTGVFGPTPVEQAAIDQLALGDSAVVEVWISVPAGSYAGTYQGQIRVLDDDGWPSDVVGVTLNVLPIADLDISDNTGNLVSNWMTFTQAPGTIASGVFYAINPNNPTLNVDPDPYGNIDLNNIYWSADDLVNTTNFLAWIPAEAISLSVDNPFALSLGADAMINLTVAIPENQIEGEYTSWVRLYDEAAQVGDSFQLRIIVLPQEDLDIVEDNIWGVGNANQELVYLNSFIVMNPTAERNPDPDGPSNANLYNLRFIAQDLIDTSNTTRHINNTNLYIAVTGQFGPTPVSEAVIDQLTLGDSAFVEVWITIPRGTRTGVYQGQIRVLDDDGWPSDAVGVTLEVLPSYDLDIADNQASLVGNKLWLAGPMGETRSGYFRVINPNNPALNVDPDPYGNADFSSLSYEVTDLVYMPAGAPEINYTIPASSVNVQLPDDGLVLGGWYDGLVSVNIPYNTFSGVYQGYVTIKGYAGDIEMSSDVFVIEVSVGALDDIDIAEEMVSGSGLHGSTVMTLPFTVWSTDSDDPTHNPDPDGPGNTTLYGVTFVAQDLRYGDNIIPASNISFVPSMVDSIRPGTFVTVTAYVNIPLGTYAGTYTGLAIATNNTSTTSDAVTLSITVEESYDLDISDNTGNLVENRMTLNQLPGMTISGNFVLINPNTPELNVDPDPYGNADLDNLTYSVSDLYHHTAPINFIPSGNVTLNLPSSINWGMSKLVSVNVTIPQAQYSGIYNGIVRVWDSETDVGDSFELRVIVESQEDVDIIESEISQSVSAGDSLVYIGLFTVVNPTPGNNPDPDPVGNIDLDNLRFSCENLVDTLNPTRIIPSSQIYIGTTGQANPTPLHLASIDLLALGNSAQVRVWAYLPRGTYASTYRGQMTVIDDDGSPSDIITLTINVEPYYDLDISDNEANLIGNKLQLAGSMGTSQTGYFRIINPNSPESNVDPDPYGNADFTSFTANVTTLNFIPVPGEASEILTSIPGDSVIIQLPTGLANGIGTNVPLTVRIPRNTRAGTYRGMVTINGYPNEPGSASDNFILEVVVGGIDDLDIDSLAVHGTGNHGTIVTTTPFRIYSTDATNNPDPDGPGNTVLYGVTITPSNLRYGSRIIPAANVSFVPSFIDSIRPGEFKEVRAVVNVPFGTFTGAYQGWAIATNNTGTTRDSVNVIITVNPYYDLDIADNQANLVGNTMILSGPMNSVREGYFRMVNPNSPELNVDPDQFGNANFVSFSVGVDTLRYVPMGTEEILYYIPPSACSVFVAEGLTSGASYDARVKVMIPNNTFAGRYRGWITVSGNPNTPGTPTDQFILEVVVGGIDDLDIDSVAVHGSANQGTVATTTSFRVWSTDAGEGHNPDPDGPGNTTLYGVSFTVSDLRAGNRIISASNVSIVPNNFDSIPSGTFRTAYARVNIPYGTYATTYTGIAIATNNSQTTSDSVQIVITVNPSYDLDISDNEQNLIGNKMRLGGMMGTVSEGRFRLINPDRPENNVDPDPYGNSNFTSLTYTATNLVYVPIGDDKDDNSEILTIIPSSAVSFFDSLPPLNWGESKNVGVRVNIPYNTLAGTYRGTVTVTGNPGNSQDYFILEVTVGRVEDLDITQSSVSGSGNQGTTVQTSSFTVWSTDGGEGHNPDPDGPGNVTLYGINFVASDLRAGNRIIPAANVSFVPALIESLYPGTSASVYARVNIPYGTYAGTYSGLITAMNNSGSTSDTVRIFITVNSDYDLDVADNMANLVSNKMTLRLMPNTQASGQFLVVNPDRPENNYDPDPYGNSDLTGIRYRVSEVLTSFDGYTLSGSAISFSDMPLNLSWGASQYVTVTASIDLSQPYATYYGTVTVYDTVGEMTIISDQFTLEVVVGPREAFTMPDTIYINGYAGEFAQTPFVVTNTGNKTIERIEVFMMTDFYNKPGGIRIPKENLQFTPPILIDSLLMGQSDTVWARIEIPRNALPTRYVARAKAMQQRGDPAKNFFIVLNVGYRADIDNGLIFSDNPVVNKNYVDIGYIYESGKPVKLIIMNMAAEIVHTKEFKEDADGVYRWYLKNDQEKDVASGIYVVINQCTLTERKDEQEQEVQKVFTKKLLIVR